MQIFWKLRRPQIRAPWVMSAMVLVLIIDQVTKAWMLFFFDPYGSVRVTSFLDLAVSQNRGVSFGLLTFDHPAAPWLLSGLALLILGVFTAFCWRDTSRSVAIALGMVAGGALGNAIDRARLGAVTDFLDLHVAGYHWPSFNLADAGIVCGLGLYLLVDAKSART